MANTNPEPIRKPYPSDVSDEEWAFVAPYLALVREDAPQRRHDLREVFNAARWVVHTGAPWRWLPHDLPPWDIVYQQTRRWLEVGVFAAVVHDLRLLLRLAAGRSGQPSAAILNSRTVQLTPESGARAGYDGHKRRKGSKGHAAVDTLGHLLALVVTPPTNRTAPRSRRWPRRLKRRPASASRRLKRRPASASRGPTSTRATPASNRLRTLPHTVSGCK